MKRTAGIIVALAVVTLAASAVFAVDTKKTAGPKKGEEKKALPVVSTVKDMSRGDIISAMKNTLGDFEDILGLVPGLKMVKTEKGEKEYTYEGVRIENLDDKRLKGLYTVVRQHAARIHAERINRQLRIAERARGLTAANTKLPMHLPSVPTPSAITPRTSPPQPPPVSKAPPAPPRTIR